MTLDSFRLEQILLHSDVDERLAQIILELAATMQHCAYERGRADYSRELSARWLVLEQARLM